MDKQLIASPDPSGRRLKGIRPVLATVLTALVAGGAVYLWAVDKQTELVARMEKLNLEAVDCQRQNQDLAAQVAEMSAKEDAKISYKDMTELAMKYCQEKKDRVGGFYSYPGKAFALEKALFLNADDNVDGEIVGICSRGEADVEKDKALFILDRQDGGYVPVLEKEENEHQRFFTFMDLATVDADKDGIDEIQYGEQGWSISKTDTYLYLYAPKYKEWFYRDDWNNRETEKKGIKYSPNLDRKEFAALRDYLSGANKPSAKE